MVVSMLFANSVIAQKAVQLTRVSSGKKVVIKEGKRVIYKLKGNSDAYMGNLESVGDSTLLIGGEKVALDQLEYFGKKSKGSAFWGSTLIILGSATIVGSIASAGNDPCPDCIDEGSSGEGWTAVEVGIGVGLIGLGANTLAKNSPRDLNEKWKIEIVSVQK